MTPRIQHSLLLLRLPRLLDASRTCKVIQLCEWCFVPMYSCQLHGGFNMARKARIFRLWSGKRIPFGDALSHCHIAILTQNETATLDIPSPYGAVATTNAIMRLSRPSRSR
ncbi:hypothetical protein BKA65DRAFT_84904 [Rhexocercosporidium sp. MPI-PUGE-AT-0058]|nr:hypothetical protein BKA65DRAFT_84904 [Rhexocercosporidium sp. MPI-PUGE-AT-0058]